MRLIRNNLFNRKKEEKNITLMKNEEYCSPELFLMLNVSCHHHISSCVSRTPTDALPQDDLWLTLPVLSCVIASDWWVTGAGAVVSSLLISQKTVRCRLIGLFGEACNTMSK